MAAKPADRIRSMIQDLERAARNLGDDLRKKAGKAGVSADLEGALRQLLQGLTSIAAQLEKAAGELRRFLEPGPAGKGGKSRKAAAKKKAPGKASAKKASAKGKASARTGGKAGKKVAKKGASAKGGGNAAKASPKASPRKVAPRRGGAAKAGK